MVANLGPVFFVFEKKNRPGLDNFFPPEEWLPTGPAVASHDLNRG
jgi:hypothetical protein